LEIKRQKKIGGYGFETMFSLLLWGVGGEQGTVEGSNLAKFLLLGGEKFLGGSVGDMVPFVMVATFVFHTEVVDFGLFDALDGFPSCLGLDSGDLGNFLFTEGIVKYLFTFVFLHLGSELVFLFFPVVGPFD
jgi:hypothetical protein